MVLVAGIALATGAAAEEHGKLTVRFSGLEEKGGSLLVSVADSREMFESDDDADLIAKVPVAGAVASAVFEGVAPGEYAVKAFHDVNENGELDMGMMGPKEKFGFSNNVIGFMGPPDFDDAKFAYDGGTETVEIEGR